MVFAICTTKLPLVGLAQVPFSARFDRVACHWRRVETLTDSQLAGTSRLLGTLSMPLRCLRQIPNRSLLEAGATLSTTGIPSACWRGGVTGCCHRGHERGLQCTGQLAAYCSLRDPPTTCRQSGVPASTLQMPVMAQTAVLHQRRDRHDRGLGVGVVGSMVCHGSRGRL